MLTEYTSTSLPILHLSLFQFLTCFLCLFFLSLSLFPPFPPFSYSCLSLQPPPLMWLTISLSLSLSLSITYSHSLLSLSLFPLYCVSHVFSYILSLSFPSLSLSLSLSLSPAQSAFSRLAALLCLQLNEAVESLAQVT